MHDWPLWQLESGASGWAEQVPVDVLHVPGTWHASLAVQTTRLLPTHTPLSHVSVCVHALPSLHPPPELGEHPPPEHAKHAPHAAPLSTQVPLALHICGCDPLHPLVPGVQVPVHAPAVQRYAHEAQVLPHALGSVWLLTHAPLQRDVPPVQLDVQVAAPPSTVEAEHNDVTPVHACPHEPQFVGVERLVGQPAPASPPQSSANPCAHA
jgi:hypothetical protein